jgi:transposase
MDAAWYEKELERRDRRIAELEAKLSRRDQRIAELEKGLADLKATLGRRSESNASKKPRFTGDYSVGRQERKGRKRRKKRSTGRRPKETKLPEVARTEEVYPVGLRPEQCTFSHDRLAWRLENGRAVLVHYLIYKGHWEFPAEMPDLLPRSEYGIEVAVLLSYLVYTVGVSINKARSLLEFFCQLRLSRSQANSLLDQLARLWESEFDTLVELMSLALVVYIDETGWKVSKKNCYAWVFTTLSHTVLLYGRMRDASVLDEILPRDRFRGIGVSDDYAAYRERFPRSQKCWSHLLRKAIALMLAHPKKRHYRRFFERLLDLYREAKRYQQDRRLGPAAREKRVVELEEKLGVLCTRWEEELPKDAASDVRAFVNLQRELMRCLGDESLFTFVVFPEVEATNNRSERTFRDTAKARATGQTSKTDHGAWRRSVILSVLTSLKQNLADFTIDAVVAEVAAWRQRGVSLFQRQLQAIRDGTIGTTTIGATAN